MEFGFVTKWHELESQFERWDQHFAVWRRSLARWEPAAADPVGANATIGDVCNQIDAALVRLQAGSPLVVKSAELSMKVRRTESAGVNMRFAVCGVGGDARAQRKSESVQTVSVTFMPSSQADGGAQGPNEFDAAFAEIGRLLQTSGGTRGYCVKSTTVSLDFVVTATGDVSIIAAGDVTDESTHNLKVSLT